ncbi:MAG: pyridoxamine 5'-phosphate oxidase family protein [Chloroflexi bacterium]|nr:pyridoxamine 5'-phosphate oxidase family protein [Chloroflexota bacterium]
MPPRKRSTELEEMSEVECLRKLALHQLGRIGFVVDGQPLVLPVNYAVSDRIITFRTAPGAKLTHAPGSRVAFEIVGYDAASGVGWSVLVQGVAVDATTALDDVSWTARGAAPRPAAPGVRVHRLAVESEGN